MANATSRSAPDQLRELIERLVGPYDATLPPAVTRAVQSLLSAKDYDDPVLIRAAFNETLGAMQEAVNEATKSRLGLPKHAQRMWQEVVEMLSEHPFESDTELDEVGKDLESRLSSWIKVLAELRDGPVSLLERNGYPVQYADQLRAEIGELERIKDEIVGNWPWSDREAPPLDEEMLKRSMEALRRGETGEPIEDLIRRLGGTVDRP